MFWQIILFILVVFVGGFLRILIKKWEVDMDGHNYDPVVLLFLVCFFLLLNLGIGLYIAFAVRYSLIFLLDYTMNYWVVLGLLYSYRFLIRQNNSSEE